MLVSGWKQKLKYYFLLCPCVGLQYRRKIIAFLVMNDTNYGSSQTEIAVGTIKSQKCNIWQPNWIACCSLQTASNTNIFCSCHCHMWLIQAPALFANRQIQWIQWMSQKSIPWFEHWMIDVSSQHNEYHMFFNPPDWGHMPYAIHAVPSHRFDM